MANTLYCWLSSVAYSCQKKKRIHDQQKISELLDSDIWRNIQECKILHFEKEKIVTNNYF